MSSKTIEIITIYNMLNRITIFLKTNNFNLFHNRLWWIRCSKNLIRNSNLSNKLSWYSSITLINSSKFNSLSTLLFSHRSIHLKLLSRKKTLTMRILMKIQFSEIMYQFKLIQVLEIIKDKRMNPWKRVKEKKKMMFFHWKIWSRKNSSHNLWCKFHKLD